MILPMPAPQSRAQEVPVLFGPSCNAEEGGGGALRKGEKAGGSPSCQGAPGSNQI